MFQAPVASHPHLHLRQANNSDPVADTGYMDVLHHSVLSEHGTFGKPLLPETGEAFSQGGKSEHDGVTDR